MAKLELPQLILGGGGLNQSHLPLLDQWYESGGRCIDTARVYGQSEQIIGDWIRFNKLDDVLVITKGCHHDEHGNRVHSTALKEDLEQSLNALQVDHIHCYILHRDDESRPPEDILGDLQAHYQEGSIGSIGASNW